MDHNQYHDQVGGVKCSLCGSDGTNKSTCPLNKDAVPNLSKHPNAVNMIETVTVGTAAPVDSIASTVTSVAPITPLIKKMPIFKIQPIKKMPILKLKPIKVSNSNTDLKQKQSQKTSSQSQNQSTSSQTSSSQSSQTSSQSNSNQNNYQSPKPSPIKFFSNKDKYFEFSNYATGYPITIDNVVYKTTEHYYQAMKYMYSGNTPADIEYANLINSQDTPNKAKVLANMYVRQNFSWTKPLKAIIEQYKGKVQVRKDWDSVKLDIMKKALKAKFTQHPRLAKLLKETNNAEIMEASPTDYFWGLGKDNTGQNQLGKLLMELRSTL